MSVNIYLDESGDLGWSFNSPYRKGGSSRYLTIAYVICPKDKTIVIKRFVKDVYKHFKCSPKIELKASNMGQKQKVYIASKLISVFNKIPEIKIGAITVKKENVQEHIRKDPNKLYNYMLKLSVLEHIKSADEAHLIRDNRSIKVKYGRCLIDYLQTELWLGMGVATNILDYPSDSKRVKNLIFIDWINNIIWNHYESHNSDAYNVLKSHISEKQLFF